MKTLTIALDWTPGRKTAGTVEVSEMEIQDMIQVLGLSEVTYEYVGQGFIFHFQGSYNDLEKLVTDNYTNEDCVENYLVKKDA